MYKHSIAPWRTAYSHSPAYIRDIKAADGEIIAQVCDFDDEVANDYSDQTIANARLIAAAPDLLAALRAILPYAENEAHALQDLRDSEVAEMQALVSWEAVNNAYAVIAKAIGEDK